MVVPGALMSPPSLFHRLMQQSVESVWSMAFDFILDNVQVVVQQAYGSTLKVTWRFTGFSTTRRPRARTEIMIVLHLRGENTASFAKTASVASWTTDTFAEGPFLWNHETKKRLIETRARHSESTQLANGDNRSRFLQFDRVSTNECSASFLKLVTFL